MKICGQEFSEEVIRRIQRTVDEESITRVALSRRVCGWLGWRSPNGKLKEMSCRVALLKLEDRGLLRLPEAKQRPLKAKTFYLTEKEEKLPAEIECRLSELGPIELIKIESSRSKQAQIWNNLMGRYHYLGAGPLCGAQQRYLIKSEKKGWLGGLAFSGSAWQISARDQWIGWSREARNKNLSKVVNNSRFLILPWVKVAHLASHVLSQACRQLPVDWRKRYGYEPVLLETFVEKARFRGTSYRAANWLFVGSSAGRGRQDRRKECAVSIKDIYVYPLESTAREKLCAGAEAAKPVKRRIDEQNWVEAEFGGAKFGDERLNQRVKIIAEDFYGRPQGSVAQACGSRAKTKAAYRFFDHEETTMENILAPHYEATRERMREEKVVLAVQDTTSLNYSLHAATSGLGPIGAKAKGAMGLLVHDTMAFNLMGTPLGLLDVQCWARDANTFGKKHNRHALPIESKESYKWLKSYQEATKAQQACPQTKVVSVGDREADIHEFFEMALKTENGAAVLVRAEQDRLSADGQGHIWDIIKNGPLQGTQVIRIPRQRQRPAREASLEIRFGKLRIKPPQRKPGLREVCAWGILAEEINAPQDIEPLKWMLLTTLEVNDFAAAVEKLEWYTLRWGIEIYHKTLKSGCKIEERQLEKADRIESCLAIDMVVAWRIFHLTKLGRETPDVPCTVFFDDSEWKALHTYIHKTPELPEKIPSLRAATHMVASMGGFLGRKCDGEPGIKSVWLGLQNLDVATAMWKVMIAFLPERFSSPVSSTPRYG